MRQSISYIDLSDLNIVDDLVYRILERAYSFVAPDKTKRFPENIGDMGLFVVKPDDSSEMHFFLCAQHATMKEMYSRLTFQPTERLIAKFIEEETPSSPSQKQYFSFPAIEGAKTEIQLNLICIKLNQLFRTATAGRDCYKTYTGSMQSVNHCGNRWFAIHIAYPNRD